MPLTQLGHNERWAIGSAGQLVFFGVGLLRALPFSVVFS